MKKKRKENVVVTLAEHEHIVDNDDEERGDNSDDDEQSPQREGANSSPFMSPKKDPFHDLIKAIFVGERLREDTHVTTQSSRPFCAHARSLGRKQTFYFPEMSELKGRYWCWTLNNPTTEETVHLSEFDGKYVCWGDEVGESGTPHLQGYVEYENPVSMSRVKDDIGKRSHIERRKGTQQQAVDYTKKDGVWTQIGEPCSGQGHRSDLDSIALAVKRGDSLTSIADSFGASWIKYNKGIQSLAMMKKPEAWRDVKVIVMWGATGTGKTRTAMEAGDIYKLNQNTNGTLWFDGYDGEKNLLLDDFYGWIKFGELLTILDGYPYRCQIKGGSAWARWTTVYITSNKSPNEWYNRDISALRRRITSERKYGVFSTGSGGGNTSPPTEGTETNSYSE